MNSIDLDLELDERLAALVARAPGRDDPPNLARRTRHHRIGAPLALAPLLVLGMVATVAAGAVVVGNLAQAHEGIENPGQPLAGAQMECMTPPEAASFLAGRGYPDVVWQVESGDPTAGGGKGPTSSIQRSTPPTHGYVIPGAIMDDGRPIMIIDQRVGATGSGECVGMPMP